MIIPRLEERGAWWSPQAVHSGGEPLRSLSNGAHHAHGNMVTEDKLEEATRELRGALRKDLSKRFPFDSHNPAEVKAAASRWGVAAYLDPRSRDMGEKLGLGAAFVGPTERLVREGMKAVMRPLSEDLEREHAAWLAKQHGGSSDSEDGGGGEPPPPPKRARVRSGDNPLARARARAALAARRSRGEEEGEGSGDDRQEQPPEEETLHPSDVRT